MPIEAVLPSPLVGGFPRLLGVVYFIALASLYRQVLPIAGVRGFAPVGSMLTQIRRDLPLHRPAGIFRVCCGSRPATALCKPSWLSAAGGSRSLAAYPVT